MATVRILRSTTTGNTPSSLVSGQIAINEADGKLFYRNSSGVVTQLATGSGGATEIYEYASSSNFPATGTTAALFIDKDRGRVFRWESNVYVEVGSVGGLGLTWSSVPASQTATGSAGAIAYDSTHLYLCVAADSWERIPFPTWAGEAIDMVTTEDGNILTTESFDPLLF